jgi:Domain of unknown function DUF29
VKPISATGALLRVIAVDVPYDPNARPAIGNKAALPVPPGALQTMAPGSPCADFLWKAAPYEAKVPAMPDDLYDRDALAWSERQAALLRRVARGERVNNVDWDHVVDEIEDVGLSELNAVRSYLRQMLAHLLKLHGWPGSDACQHWRNEVATFQVDAIARYAPSMQQRINLPGTYELAQRQIAPMRRSDRGGLPAPATCPLTLDQLLTAPVEDLEAAFTSQRAG